MVVYVKNMICVRCKMAVESVLEALNIPWRQIELGKITFDKKLGPDQLGSIDKALKYFKLEIMEDRKKILSERVKNALTAMLNSDEPPRNLKLSVYLSEQLHYNYTYLANIFSETEGITLERFYIEQKVERIKELIVYEKYSVTEISYQLQYSSPSHLCLQFKKVTGKTPAEFKKLCLSEEYRWRE